jgi:hypothetical protein
MQRVTSWDWLPGSTPEPVDAPVGVTPKVCGVGVAMLSRHELGAPSSIGQAVNGGNRLRSPLAAGPTESRMR